MANPRQSKIFGWWVRAYKLDNLEGLEASQKGGKWTDSEWGTKKARKVRIRGGQMEDQRMAGALWSVRVRATGTAGQ